MSTRMRPLLLVGLGLAIACYGWFDVRRRARIDRGPRFHRTDFTVYQYAARAMKTGDDPYEARNPRGYRYVYPPFFAALLVPVADWDPPDAAMLFFALSMLLLVDALITLRGMPGPRGDPVGWKAVLIGLFLCVGFFHQSFQRGQVTVLLVALQVVAMAAVLRKRWFVGGLALALAGAVRLTPFLSLGAVGLALLVLGARAGWMRFVHFAGGAAAGLVLAFVVVPWAVLGADDAKATTERWWESTQHIYGRNADADLMRDYKINEWRFKNQAPRRVFGTWVGWASGARFEKERPDLSANDQALAANAALAVALFAVVAAVFIALRAFASDDPRRWIWALAWTGFLPVLVTRYTWPTHFTAALPVLVLVAARGRRLDRTSQIVFLLGTGLFYLAHAKVLQPVGAIGPLLLAACVVCALQRPDRGIATS